MIAGEFRGIKGPARTFTPIHLYELRLKVGHRTELTLPAGYNTGVFLLKGNVVLNGSHSVKGAELALFATQGERVSIEAKKTRLYWCSMASRSTSRWQEKVPL